MRGVVQLKLVNKDRKKEATKRAAELDKLAQAQRAFLKAKEKRDQALIVFGHDRTAVVRRAMGDMLHTMVGFHGRGVEYYASMCGDIQPL